MKASTSSPLQMASEILNGVVVDEEVHSESLFRHENDGAEDL